MIRDNILRIRQKIVSLCAEINRNPDSIVVIAASKERPVNQIEEAISSGLADIGENRVQEAMLKYRDLRTHELTNSRTIKWHMIGHLQTNKAKEAVRIFDLIQSVDSLHLAQELDRQACKINKIQGILMEIKTSPEAAKFGFKPEEAIKAAEEIAKLKNLTIKGLMTIAPLTDKAENSRPYFRKLRDLKDKIGRLSTANCQLSILSMGMTDDFEVAIEEGATMIRLGRAIFE